jgi:hypothetical protein
VSIYATLWSIRFEDPDRPDEWTEVTAQAVPPHIGSEPEYEKDPFGSFLPPPVPADSRHARAVVFVTEETEKGTDRSGQEYRDPLLVLTGDEYARSSFKGLLERIWYAIGRSTVACSHKWELIEPVFLSNTPEDVKGQAVPHEWCSLCGSIRHDFLGTREPTND